MIKELTAAKMRAMMQGIVMEGTGKAAQLNGYSAGGKTGTANKVDLATHTYSHTKLVASFAGFAPVSNPAISVAVVIDTPTVGTRYGAEPSAPGFAEVAQGDIHGRVDHESLGTSLHQVGCCLASVGDHAGARTWFERAVAEVERADELVPAVETAIAGGGVRIVRVRTERAANALRHAQVFRAVAEALGD